MRSIHYSPKPSHIVKGTLLRAGGELRLLLFLEFASGGSIPYEKWFRWLYKCNQPYSYQIQRFIDHVTTVHNIIKHIWPRHLIAQLCYWIELWLHHTCTYPLSFTRCRDSDELTSRMIGSLRQICPAGNYLWLWVLFGITNYFR